MKEIKWLDGNRIQIEPPRRFKKCTGTRFATILGLNPWSTPFEMWCAITRTYEKPFIDSIYTIAGKTIEPKQAEYMKNSYGMELISPTDRYGEDYFQKTHGDFFPSFEHLGGMWDFLGVNNETKEIDTIFEMKTTKRIEDWSEDVPEYYALQAALYAYLFGVDNVIMVASFLEKNDYNAPENYKPTIHNTITREFKVSERYPDFTDKVGKVEAWWKKYVETGISPPYDEKKDAEILKVLRTHSLSPDTDIKELIAEAEKLKAEVDSVYEAVKVKEKKLDSITATIKEYAATNFRDGDKNVVLDGETYSWNISKWDKEKVVYNADALKADGVYDKYVSVTPETSYRMTVKRKGDK